MPVDVRKLIFSKDEVLAAFKDYCREQHMVDKQEPIEDFVIDEKTPTDGHSVVAAAVSFASNNPQKPHQIKLDQDKIFEVLVSTCKNLKIPLPRQGTKFVRKHNDGLMMIIGISEKEMKNTQPV